MSRTQRNQVALLVGLCGILTGLAAAFAGSASSRPGPSPGGAAAWKAVAATGRVESRPAAASDLWSSLRRGDLVAPESSVRTFKRSRTTLASGGDVILVDPASEIVLPAVAPGSPTVIRQGSGNALYRIDPTAQRSVRVETPWLVAGVKGTVFSVVVSEAYASVSVASGRVAVRCLVTGEVADLHSGDMAVFDAGLGAMEVYRERREDAREKPPEVSRSAKESLDATVDLLEEASASLTTKELGSEALGELTRMDLSLWTIERDLRALELDKELEEDDALLTGDEDQRLLDKVGLKSP